MARGSRRRPAALVANPLRVFEALFALTLVVEYWARALPRWAALDSFYIASLPLVAVVAAATFSRWRQPAFAILALIQFRTLWAELPATGNHAYLQLVFLILATILDPAVPGDQILYRRSLNWLLALVLFYSGVQKLIHGYYFQGEMLAYSLETNSFQPVLKLILPAGEYQRLLAFKGHPGDGPYVVDSALFVGFSNLVWIAEIGLAALLLLPRLAKWAAWAVIGLLAAIEAAAREVFFGITFIAPLLLFFPPVQQRRISAALALALLALLLSRAGILPEATFY